MFGEGLTTAEPGSAQGLYLIVTDIEAARAELLERGIPVSEVFHDGGGVLFHGHADGTATHDLPAQQRLAGRHPEGSPPTPPTPRSATPTATAGSCRRSPSASPAGRGVRAGRRSGTGRRPAAGTVPHHRHDLRISDERSNDGPRRP